MVQWVSLQLKWKEEAGDELEQNQGKEEEERRGQREGSLGAVSVLWG